MPNNPCDAACVKAILDASNQASARASSMSSAALLAWNDPKMRPRVSLTPADVSAYDEACKAFCAATDHLRGLFGFPVIS